MTYIMNDYQYQQTLKAIWQKAVDLYKSGQRGSDTFFDADDMAFLASIGHSAREVYDFAEDWVNYQEPDFETFLLLAALRRQYFLHVMGGESSGTIVDTGDLTPKKTAVRGIEWLPRLIEKARAKLRGEMSDDLMYLCSGDRSFFRTRQIHPAEFLQFVMEHFEDDEAIVDFVVQRSKTGIHP